MRLQVQALGGTLFFTPGEVVLSLPTPTEKQTEMALPGADAIGQPDALAMSSEVHSPTATEVQEVSPPTVVRVHWDGANPTPEIAGATRLPGVVNYVRGNDPAQWRTNVPTYAGVVYNQLYPGIDLRYDGQGGALKGTYHVAPGVDPAQIRWRYDGAAQPVVDASGALMLRLGAATLTEQPPVAWQEIAGQRRNVAIQYAVGTDGGVGFALGSYDAAYPLTLDPELTYSTYWSEHGSYPTDVSADRAGNAFLVGGTSLATFPVKNAIQPTCRKTPMFDYCGTDAFITKFGPDGTVLYSTYLGGQGDETNAKVAVDATGHAYMTGITNSSDFPTKNAQQPSCTAEPTAVEYCQEEKLFLTKLTPDGAIAFSTYWGGSSRRDFGESAATKIRSAVAVDAAGNAIIAGTTVTTDFPVKNAIQPGSGSCPSTCQNAFVTKFTPAGAVVYSTYLGGTSGDEGSDIATDGAGNAYVTGTTDSLDFPIKNAYQPVCGQNEYHSCAFVTKLTPAGALAYSTYLGGGADSGRSIAADAAGNVHITGETYWDIFPATNRTYCTHDPCEGAFVAGLSPTGTLVYGTVFSAETFNNLSYTGLRPFAVDPEGHAIVAFEQTLPFPGQVAADASCLPTTDYRHCGQNALVFRLSNSGTVMSATTLGGRYFDSSEALAVDASGNIYVTGITYSRDFPLRNAAQSYCEEHEHNSCYNMPFLTKIRASNMAISATVDRPTVAATNLVMATVIVTNTDVRATPAVTLTLTEGDGMLHAPDSDDSFGRAETVDGLNNVVHFDSGPFAAGEQKTFKVPLLVTPLPITDTTEVQVVRSVFGAHNAAGNTARTEIAVNVTGLEQVWDNAPPFDRLPGLPVADIGTTPDAPFDPGGAAPFDPAGVLPLAFRPMQGANPSITGNLWDFYLNGDSFSKWSRKDKILFGLLRRANISQRDAYAIVYIKALIGMAPSKPSLPGWVELRKAAWKLWWGIEKAKKTGNQDGIKDAFKDAMGALDTVNAQYFSSLLEFHDGYSRPAVTAVQDRFRTFALDDRRIQRLIYGYYNGDISEFDFKRQMPFASLVQYDVSNWLAYRRYPRAVHVKLLSQVQVKRNDGGGTRNLALVIDELLRGDVPDGFAGPLPAQLQPHWTGVQVHSPLLPLVTDAQGRRAGVDARTGVVYDEIPGAIITPGHPWQLAIPAASETLRVQYTTAYPYAFGIDVVGLYNGAVTSKQSFGGTATEGYTADQTIAVTKNTTSVEVRASPLDPPPTDDTKVFLPAIRR